MIGSDNASCVEAYDYIPHIHHLNKKQGITIIKYMRADVRASRNRLDTHFIFVNLNLKLCVIEGSDVIIEKDTHDAISFQEGIAGNTSIMFDRDPLKGPVLKNNKKSMPVELA